MPVASPAWTETIRIALWTGFLTGVEAIPNAHIDLPTLVHTVPQIPGLGFSDLDLRGSFTSEMYRGRVDTKRFRATDDKHR